MGSSCSPQSELTPLFLGLARGYPVATRCSGDCIMRVAQDIKGHADLASSSPSSPFFASLTGSYAGQADLKACPSKLREERRRGQSRQTLVTGNEGCVR